MTLPNKITLLRILASPVLFLLLAFVDTVASWVTAFGIFLAAALTDLYDGYLARKYGVITDLGKVIDPLADKALLSAAFLAFYLRHRAGSPICQDVALWVILVVLGREGVIMAFRYFALSRGEIIPASGMAKAKTFAQNLFIGSILIRFLHHALSVGHPTLLFPALDSTHAALNETLLWVVIVLTVLSGAAHLWKNRHIFRSSLAHL